MVERWWMLAVVVAVMVGMGVGDPLSEEGLALLAMRSGWVDPQGRLESWKLNGTATPCLWAGIACNNASAVVALFLGGMNLTGTLSADLGRLRSLVNVSLELNNLTGPLPPEVTSLVKLQYLNVSNNDFGGAFPSNFSQLLSLQVLDCFNNNFTGLLPVEIWTVSTLEHLSLGGNYFEGGIPWQYGSFPSLRYLGLSGNSLSGPIPPELGSLHSLQELYMGYYNNYSSGIPATFGNLTSLIRLDMGRCGLTGTIPRELGNLGNLDTLFLQLNSLEGVVPVEIGNIVNLKSLDLSYNNLSGVIPPALIYLQKLELLSLMSNRFEGSIPEFLGEMPSLQVLYLWANRLTGPIPELLGRSLNLTLLDLSSNQLTGGIPKDLCAGQKLEWLILKENALTGAIPENLGNCMSLTKMRLGRNNLNGSIPLGLLGLPNITMVEVQENHLTGPIPSEIIDAPRLSYLDLSSNELSSALPESIGNLPNLQSFLIRNNHFEGPIPPQICDMASLNKLDLSGNEFTGTIPEEISNCKKLGSLDFSRNGLTGTIPPQVEYIPDLFFLNLSRNQLSGRIPPQLQLLQTLTMFDFSYNNFSGPIPRFDSYNVSAFEGNPFLCGGMLKACSANEDSGAGDPRQPHRKRTNLLAWLVGTLFSAAFLVLLVGVCCFFRKYRFHICTYFKRESTTRPWKLTAFSRLDLTASQVLDCLDEENIIGRGGAGTVYKGVMASGQVVAVKRLAGEGKGAAHDHGFSAEIQTLGKIRHRNIVRLLGCCSNHETNLLIYEYMPNGSLGELLHSKERSENLDWETRYNIAVQAAHGLCYLHHDCSPLIVHRDVKSNNILLDSTFQAHVADFGLAKLFQDTGKSESMSSIAGSYGYIAPEYAYTLKVNEKSDIYSFGVVLMELLTGKRPIETEFGDGVDIVQWVRRKIQTKDGVLDVLDPRMGGVGVPLQEVMLVLRVALLCSSDLPVDRPTMRDVVQMLSDVKPKSKGSSLADSRELAAPDTFKPQDLRLVSV